jgi:asparagine synthase (glutamine-hydrolysing)
MCGILGGINTRFDEQSLERLAHRGPDQQALWSEATRGGWQVTLGQTRLNVVDRNDIDLPVRIGDAAIVFNGQVYNHPELRAELAGLGHTFSTQTDTEVVLAAYLEWGVDCLTRFNGMFALAIWDGEKLFCARDRMGKKPFFYRCRNRGIEFASEIKAFDKLEFTTHELFDLFEFCFNEHTLYRGILSLRPGQYLIYDPEQDACRTRQWWDIEQNGRERVADEKQAVGEFIELLEDAVRLRMRADTPVTLFLAGGLDSSLIAKLSGVKQAFTCQFDEFRSTINEEAYVTDLADRLGIQSQMVRPTREQFLRDLASVSYHLEMPTGSFSAFAIYRLARAAKECGYKVALSGEGSDELFAGYARNELLVEEDGKNGSAKHRHYAAMLERYRGSDFDRFCRMASRSGLVGAGLIKMHLADLWSARRSTLENIAYIESRVFMQPLLQMADRMCMAHGVENRCPFLDHRLVEFAFSLDDSLRYRDGIGKWIVHRAAEKLLPKGSLVLQRPVKDGLPTPANLWLHGTHSFDRKHWNALMTAECIRSLLAPPGGRVTATRSVSASDILPVLHEPGDVYAAMSHR